MVAGWLLWILDGLALSPRLLLCLSQEGEASWLPLFLAKGEQRSWELVSVVPPAPANSSPASGPGLVLTHDLGTCSVVSLSTEDLQSLPFPRPPSHSPPDCDAAPLASRSSHGS